MIVHGLNTPHKFPSNQTENLVDLLGNLAFDLYPTGRAFSFQKGGVSDAIHNAINKSFTRFLEDNFLFLDSLMPDLMTLEDCLLWEYRLGLITNSFMTLQERQSAIFRKLSRGRNVRYRHTKEYIETQLQLAGFDVFVYENTIPYTTPESLLSLGASSSQYGDPSQYGVGMEYGSINFDLIANSIRPKESFSVGSENLWATFFICGDTLGSMASVPLNRQTEFRELVLKLKPAHLVAYTFVNYI